MPNKVVSTSIDETLERAASKVLAPMGLTVAEAFRLMLVQIAEDKALPFRVLVPNAETVAAMERARAGDLTVAGRPDQLLAHLDADD
jgi:DNA-damage-inducible protein J